MGSKRTGISREAAESAERAMSAVRQGNIKKHLLGNNSPVRYGAVERKEMAEYEEFVRTKLCYEILSLRGSGIHEFD